MTATLEPRRLALPAGDDDVARSPRFQTAIDHNSPHQIRNFDNFSATC